MGSKIRGLRKADTMNGLLHSDVVRDQIDAYLRDDFVKNVLGL
jgi:hypothetical protein